MRFSHFLVAGLSLAAATPALAQDTARLAHHGQWQRVDFDRLSSARHLADQQERGRPGGADDRA